MAEERSRNPTGAVPLAGSGPPSRSTAQQRQRDPRAAVVVPVRYRYENFIHFIETQSMNVSKSGIFLHAAEPAPVGSAVEFELSLADGFMLIRGHGEVVRISASPPGLGVRFQTIDDASRKLIERIVQVNVQEGKRPAIPLDFHAQPPGPPPTPGRPPVPGTVATPGPAPPASGVEFSGRDLRVTINHLTAGFFTNNPLLNIRLGGFVVPGQEEVPLGTLFGVTIADGRGGVIWTGKGKVVAKHEMRLGIRLLEVAKDTLARLQTEVARTASPGK